MQEICRNILRCKRSNLPPQKPLGREMEYPLLAKDGPCRKGSGDANRGRKHSMPDAGVASWAAYVLVPIIVEKAASPPTARVTGNVMRISPAGHAPPASHPLCNASQGLPTHVTLPFVQKLSWRGSHTHVRWCGDIRLLNPRPCVVLSTDNRFFIAITTEGLSAAIGTSVHRTSSHPQGQLAMKGQRL